MTILGMPVLLFLLLFIVGWATIALIYSLFYTFFLQLGKKGLMCAAIILVFDIITFYVVKYYKRYTGREIL